MVQEPGLALQGLALAEPVTLLNAKCLRCGLDRTLDERDRTRAIARFWQAGQRTQGSEFMAQCDIEATEASARSQVTPCAQRGGCLQRPLARVGLLQENGSQLVAHLQSERVRGVDLGSMWE